MIHITHDDSTALHVEGNFIELAATRAGEREHVTFHCTPRDVDQLLCELLAARLADRESCNLALAYNELSRELAMPQLPPAAALHPAGSVMPRVRGLARVRSRWS